MEGAAAYNYNPRTVEEVFRDFQGRRAGMIKALTTEVDEFYQLCDPEKENLCLYGFPSEQWEVNLPAEEVPPELPEPVLGINFARDGMPVKDWLALVAVHSNAWLLSVAFYFGARFGFDKADRKRLFNMINDLPTIFEVISGTAKKNQKKKIAVSNNHSSTKSKSNSKLRDSESQGKYPKQPSLPQPAPRMNAYNYNPRTVEEVFRDFQGCRAGMIKALTTEVDEFYQLCDPEKENLCLYGFPSEQWEVNLPAEEIPPDLPEPVLGINFARDGMQVKDWLAFVAVHSDAWLLSVAFYFGARFGFDKADRKRLFNMINDLPTIFEVISGTAKKNQKEKIAVSNNHSSTKSKSNSKLRDSESQGKYPKQPSLPQSAPRMNAYGGPDEDDDDEDEHGETLCGVCGENYASDEFWICCDVCEKCFHGKCVNITPARVEHIKQYKCPTCSNKSARP